jgi:type II secretory pathway component PulJ
MIPLEYLVIALGVLVLYVIYYVLSKDAQQQRQIRAIATAVEELNRHVYKMEKRLNERLLEAAGGGTDEEREALHREIEREMQHIAASLSESIMSMERGLGHFKTDVEKRLHHVEEGMRQLTMPASVTGMDDEKIISLYKQGIGLDAIAKELRLSKAEVEFVLKINKIR